MNLDHSFAQVIVPRPVRTLFTYSVPGEMREAALPGARVVVPFGRKKLIGLIARRSARAEVETKPILQMIDDQPVSPPDIIELALWAARHYFAAPGEMLQLISPRDDVEIDSVVELKTNATPPGPRSPDSAVRIYESLEENGGARRLKLLASDVEMTPGELKKTLKRASVARFAEIKEKARHVAVRRSQEKGQGSTDADFVTLNKSQSAAFGEIAPDIGKGRFNVHLIYGVTGSGKTEVYAHLVQKALDLGKSALALAPEIALADMLAERLRRRLGLEPFILHSEMTPRERGRRWQAVKNGEVKLVVGARSAVFAPLSDLGVIIVDEEHDTSYKQESAPRYNGRDLAIKRGAICGVPVVLGSATPSFESYHNALTGKYSLIELASRVDDRPMPKVETVKPETPGEIGSRLRDEIRSRLDRGEQVMLFINRRGAARFVQCSMCGHVFECRNCSLSLVSHASARTLDCHTCGYSEPAPDTCPKCHSSDFFMGGSGTEKVERDVRELFPGARVARMDRDTTSRRRSSAKILRDLEKGEVDILVGTQMITKGHDYPGITLVGAISVEDTLRLPDFRASERTFQLLTQAAGRAGRGERGGLVIAQTISEGHHSVTAASNHDFKAFYEKEAVLRKMVGYPPFARLAFVRIDAATVSRGEEFLKRAEPVMRRAVAKTPGVAMLGPAPAVVFKVRNRYHWRVLLKAPSHARLAEGLRHLLSSLESAPERLGVGVNLAVDMDPTSAM